MIEELTFVVTGGARGIGEAIVRSAVRGGANVMIADLDEEVGRQLADELGPAVVDVRRCDVTDEGDVTALMEQAAERFGGIDVLVNNAGVHEAEWAGGELRLESMQPKTFRRVMDVNVMGPFLCSKAALPFLRQSDFPSIINAASVCSLVGYPSAVAYGASKGAVALLTKNLAVDLAPYGIRVNCYCPASIATRKLDPYTASGQDPDALREALTETHLVHRLGQPSDVAELVCFLAGRNASFINGAEILVDGGSLAWRGRVAEIGMGQPA